MSGDQVPENELITVRRRTKLANVKVNFQEKKNKKKTDERKTGFAKETYCILSSNTRATIRNIIQGRVGTGEPWG